MLSGRLFCSETPKKISQSPRAVSGPDGRLQYSRHVAESGKLPAEMFDHILFIDAAVHMLIRERVCLVS